MTIVEQHRVRKEGWRMRKKEGHQSLKEGRLRRSGYLGGMLLLKGESRSQKKSRRRDVKHV